MSLEKSKGNHLRRADSSTIQDKFLVGYQGWFTCAGDGVPVGPGHHGWLHWFNYPIPDGGRPNTDIWPDVSEYSISELYAAPGLRTQSGEQCFLFSSRHPKSVQRHFHWMARHGVDGAFLQRFAGQCDLEHPGNEGIFRIREEVGDRVRDAAEKEGRVFAIMYDVTGVAPDRIQGVIQRDWGHLVHTKAILDSPNYLREQGRAVVALWGFGFAGNNHSPSVVRAITSYLRDNTPGGVYIMAGVPAHWRTSIQDADPNPDFVDVWLNSFDAISPWTIGRYSNADEADRFAQEKIKPDVELIKRKNDASNGSRKVDYIPVVFPGGSGNNLSEGAWGFNNIKRNGGRFLWQQAYNARLHGARIVYGAMWDEYDEGTAFMPVVPYKNQLPVSDRHKFLSLDADGYDLPSDWYMRICGLIAEGLRGERRIHETFPSKDLDDYWSTRPRYEDKKNNVSYRHATSGDGIGFSDGLAVSNPDEPPPPPYALQATTSSAGLGAPSMIEMSLKHSRVDSMSRSTPVNPPVVSDSISQIDNLISDIERQSLSPSRSHSLAARYTTPFHPPPSTDAFSPITPTRSHSTRAGSITPLYPPTSVAPIQEPLISPASEYFSEPEIPLPVPTIPDFLDTNSDVSSPYPPAPWNQPTNTWNELHNPWENPPGDYYPGYIPDVPFDQPARSDPHSMPVPYGPPIASTVDNAFDDADHSGCNHHDGTYHSPYEQYSPHGLAVPGSRPSQVHYEPLSRPPQSHDYHPPPVGRRPSLGQYAPVTSSPPSHGPIQLPPPPVGRRPLRNTTVPTPQLHSLPPPLPPPLVGRRPSRHIPVEIPSPSHGQPPPPVGRRPSHGHHIPVGSSTPSHGQPPPLVDLRPSHGHHTPVAGSTPSHGQPPPLVGLRPSHSRHTPVASSTPSHGQPSPVVSRELSHGHRTSVASPPTSQTQHATALRSPPSKNHHGHHSGPPPSQGKHSSHYLGPPAPENLRRHSSGSSSSNGKHHSSTLSPAHKHKSGEESWYAPDPSPPVPPHHPGQSSHDHIASDSSGNQSKLKSKGSLKEGIDSLVGKQNRKSVQASMRSIMKPFSK